MLEIIYYVKSMSAKMNNLYTLFLQPFLCSTFFVWRCVHTMCIPSNTDTNIATFTHRIVMHGK